MARLHARTISQRLSKADKPDAAGWSWVELLPCCHASMIGADSSMPTVATDTDFSVESDELLSAFLGLEPTLL